MKYSSSKSIFYSPVIEDELKKRFISTSYKKLREAQKGGSDPLRKSLQVLKILHDLKYKNIRLETECSALLYLPVTPDPLPRQKRTKLPSPLTKSSSSSSSTSSTSKMIVIFEQAPPQKIISSTISSTSQNNDTIVPNQDDNDFELNSLDEMIDDGGSIQRKRKANGVSDAGRCDSKLRIYESESN